MQRFFNRRPEHRSSQGISRQMQEFYGINPGCGVRGTCTETLCAFYKLHCISQTQETLLLY